MKALEGAKAGPILGMRRSAGMNAHSGDAIAGFIGVAFAIVVGCGSALARGAVFQWSGTVDDLVSSETKAHPRAFLWVPEGCERGGGGWWWRRRIWRRSSCFRMRGFGGRWVSWGLRRCGLHRGCRIFGFGLMPGMGRGWRSC